MQPYACACRNARGKRLVALDDMFTTGATMNACAEVVRECRIQSVMLNQECIERDSEAYVVTPATTAKPRKPFKNMPFRLSSVGDSVSKRVGETRVLSDDVENWAFSSHPGKDKVMKTGKQINGFAVGLCALGFVVLSASAGTIYQSGGAGTTYTDALGDQQGSSNLLRDLSSVTVSNDAGNLYITININPAGNIATGGAFNYVIGITTGDSSAGGDTSAATDHGNPYGRAISFDTSFGGMMDWIGVFGAGGSGSVASPYTSYGFNDYAYGTPGAVGITNGGWTKIHTVSSGEPIGIQPSTSISNSVTITVPMSDFSANLSLTPGTTIDFDVCSTGTSGNQTAYDSLAVQTPIQGTYSSTAQFNETVLDQYTITAVPEPSTIGLVGIALFGALALRRRKT